MKKTEIIHLIDIGNTSASYAICRNGQLGTVESLNYDKIPKKVLKSSKNGLKSKNIAVIACVVPEIGRKIKSEIYASSSQIQVCEIGQDIPVSLSNKYKSSNKLGIDRKINAYGAMLSHKLPCLVLDYGTALTCDLVDEKGVFLGGLIIPGPATALKSLLKQTALLPKVFTIKKESGRPYGRNTNECIQHGIIQAYAAMTDGLIAKLSEEFTRKPHVIITGGFASFIGKIIHSKATINPAHTLQTMLKIYRQK